MTALVFCDNTVLCNFACVHRLDLLKSVLNGRGRWTEAVAYEAARSAKWLPDLARLPAEGWLGEPVQVTSQTEIEQVERIRRAVFGGTEDEPLKHLGETQTCFVLLNWQALAGSVWASDDRDAIRYAKRQGLTAWETVDVVAQAVISGDLADAKSGFALLTAMADRGQGLRLPVSPRDLLT